MKNELYQPHQSSIGNLRANAMALICYGASVVLGFIPIVRYAAWVAPLVLFLMEKQSKFVKFHAMQSFLLHVVGAALSLVVSLVLRGIIGAGSLNAASFYAAAGISGVIGLLTTIISIVILVFTIIAMVGAYHYKETHIPVIGGIAEKLSQKK